MWSQKTLHLRARPRGFHLITDEIEQQLPEIRRVSVGLLHLFIQHTSASLTLNENADPTVRMDMEAHFNQFVPERASYYQHTYEGDDDMPAHIKAAMMSVSLSIPILAGELALGTWQGVYVFEHRNAAHRRRVVAHLSK